MKRSIDEDDPMFSYIRVGLGMALILVCTPARTFAQGVSLPTQVAKIEGKRAVPPILRELSLTEFGGVGDGITDNAIAFKKAIESLEQAGGGTLIIPVGTFNTSATIELHTSAPIIIRGLGSKHSVIRYTGSGDGFSIRPHVLDMKSHLFLHLAIFHLRIEGTASARDGIAIADASEFEFDDVGVDGFGRDGMRAQSSQYGHISNSTFSANGRHGLNFSIGTLEGKRGAILNNTWQMDNVFFMSNRGWGYRDQDGFNISCTNCTFQSNQGGGSLETGDTDEEVGEERATTRTTGVQPTNNIYENCHWEWNGNINEYLQYGQRIRTIAPVFASESATNGDWIVGPHAAEGMILEQPFWLSRGPHIVILGGAYHRVDTGGVAVETDNSRHSFLYRGNQILSSLEGPTGMKIETDSSHGIILTGGTIALHSTGAGGIQLYPSQSSNPYHLSGKASQDRSLQLPDANSSTVWTNSPRSNEPCTPPSAVYDSSFAYFCVAPGHWKRTNLSDY